MMEAIFAVAIFFVAFFAFIGWLTAKEAAARNNELEARIREIEFATGLKERPKFEGI